MRHLLTLVSLLLVGSVWADDFNFNSPRAKAAMEKYQYDKEDLLRDLEAALEHERTKGSLEEAIKIRDAIATLKQQPDAPVADARMATETPLPVGVWRNLTPGNTDLFIIRPDGTAHHSGRKFDGRWQAAKGSGRDFIIHWPNGTVDNIEINNGKKE